MTGPVRKIPSGAILACFAVAHLCYAAMMFTLPAIEAGMSVRLFDLRMFTGYDVAYALTFLSELTAAGRAVYFHAQFWLDLVYPLAAGAFFATWFVRATGKRSLLWLGVLSAAADLLENLLVFRIVTEAPGWTSVVPLASGATIVKGILYLFNYGFALFLSIRALVLKRRAQA